MRLRAKVAVLLAVLALVVLVVGLTRGQEPGPTAAATPASVLPSVTAATAATPSSPSDAPEPTPSSVLASGAPTPMNPLSRTAQARRRWEPTVRGFGTAFTEKKLSSAQWRARLDPYAESPVREALRGYDRKQVPGQKYQGYDILDASDADVVVQVSYADGWALVLYLHTADQQRWLVHAFDRLEE